MTVISAASDGGAPSPPTSIACTPSTTGRGPTGATGGDSDRFNSYKPRSYVAARITPQLSCAWTFWCTWISGTQMLGTPGERRQTQFSNVTTAGVTVAANGSNTGFSSEPWYTP